MNFHESRGTGEQRTTEAPSGRKVVLIVEDNELNMKLFHDLLAAHGYTTIQTRNGLEALEALDRTTFDVVLMDCQMPEMNGYEATAALFRGGWLHTGDLVKRDLAGRFYYVGRKKEMIRRSGENISAAEVEETIASHPAVRMAACVPVPDDIRGEEVKAYVVLRDGAAAEPAEISAHCEARLAYFKVPRYWTFVDDLPRTPSERIVKHVLVSGVEDLRAGAWDRVDDVWR